LPVDYLAEAYRFTRERQLALHIDGARIFNAAVALELPLEALSRYCDTLTICLSKGLGAPVGSLLCGDDAYIQRARRWRKMTGGGMRQAGILAAAGLYALENNVMRLKEDHDNARWLAEQLSALGLSVSQHTNMVFAQLPPEQAAPLKAWMQARNILISAAPVTRLVTHMDVDRAALQQVVSQWKDFLAAQ